MQFIRDAVARRNGETDQRLPQRDAWRKPAGEGARDDGTKSQVADCVRGLVRYTWRQRRLMERGEVEDRGHVDQDRTPMREKCAVIQNSQCSIQNADTMFLLGNGASVETTVTTLLAGWRV